MKPLYYFLMIGLTAYGLKAQSQTSRPLFRLIAGYGDETGDPMVIYFDNKNSVAFHKDFDALKLMNTDLTVPNIYSLAADGSRLSIQALPDQDLVNKVIPVGLKTGHESVIDFNAISIVKIPYPYIYFIDAQTLKAQELHTNPKLTVRLPAGTYEKRFSILFSLSPYKPGSAAPEWSAYSSKAKLHITLDTLTGNSGVLNVFTITGQEVFNETLSGKGMHILDPQLPEAIYLIRLKSSTGIYTKKVFIGL